MFLWVIFLKSWLWHQLRNFLSKTIFLLQDIDWKLLCLCLVIPWSLSSVVILLWWSLYKFVSENVVIHSSSHQSVCMIGWKLEIFNNLLQNNWNEWMKRNCNKKSPWVVPSKIVSISKATFPNGHVVVILKWWYQL